MFVTYLVLCYFLFVLITSVYCKLQGDLPLKDVGSDNEYIILWIVLFILSPASLPLLILGTVLYHVGICWFLAVKTFFDYLRYGNNTKKKIIIEKY